MTFLFHFSRNSIDVFGLSIHYYGILIALGVLLGVLLAARRQKRMNLPPETGLDLALICLPVAVVCARAYYVIFEWSAYKDDLLSIFNLRRGGLAIYGGVLGGALAVFVYSRIKKRPFLSLADLAAPSLALGQAVGRWGNFFNQEAYGAAVTQPSRMHFPLAVFIDADQTWHYATFFYESAWCFLIVALLLLFERRRFFRKRGDVFFWYLILYGLERAAVEGLRTDSLYWGPVRVSQALSLLAVLAVCAVFARRRGRFGKWGLLCPIPALAALILVPTRLTGCLSPLALALYALTLLFAFLQYLPASSEQ